MFLNITLAEALEEKKNNETLNIGTIVIRGNSIVSLEVCILKTRTTSKCGILTLSRHLKKSNL